MLSVLRYTDRVASFTVVPRNVTYMSLPHHLEGRRPTVSMRQNDQKVLEPVSLGLTRMIILKPSKTVENFFSWETKVCMEKILVYASCIFLTIKH